MWSESFSGELRDTLILQHRVAQAIATEIRCTLNPRERARLRQNTVVEPEAYEAYLKGRYFWNKRTGDDLRTAAEYFNEAIVPNASSTEPSIDSPMNRVDPSASTKLAPPAWRLPKHNGSRSDPLMG